MLCAASVYASYLTVDRLSYVGWHSAQYVEYLSQCREKMLGGGFVYSSLLYHRYLAYFFAWHPYILLHFQGFYFLELMGNRVT